MGKEEEGFLLYSYTVLKHTSISVYQEMSAKVAVFCNTDSMY